MACCKENKSPFHIRLDKLSFSDLIPVGAHVPLKLVFSDINLSCGDKNVLKDVCGRADPGEVLAIMGPSGSGKTSLLNAISGRVSINSGTITLGGKNLTKDLKRQIALVQQKDIFLANLTLGYTLQFYARMLLPSSMSDEQKMEFKNRIASLFKLDEILNTSVGNVLKRGLSGGELKRANIACEMFSLPSVLLVDEPTTGLDSHNALNVIQVLKNYAVNNHTTVIVTVHQPSSLMFQMFDKLLLMGDGQVAYFGNRADVIDKFAQLGMGIEPHYNPADFIVDQLHDSTKLDRLTKAAQESSEPEPEPADIPTETVVQLQAIMGNGQANGTHNVIISRQELDQDSGRSSLFSDSCQSYSDDKWAVPFCTQVRLLTQRNFKSNVSRCLTIENCVHSIILSLVVAGLWFQILRIEKNLSSMKGEVFFKATIWLLSASFEAMNAFPEDRDVINRERASGMYRLSAYYLAKMIGELPIVLVYPTVFYFITYPSYGVSNVITFFFNWMILLLSVLVSQSVGLFVGAICPDVKRANIICSLYCLPNILFGGFLVTSIPFWLSWLRYTSTVYYAFNAMQIVEFVLGNPIECAAENSLFEACRLGNSTFIPPSDIVETDNPLFDLQLYVLILVSQLILFRLLGYLALRFYKSPTRTL